MAKIFRSMIRYIAIFKCSDLMLLLQYKLWILNAMRHKNQKQKILIFLLFFLYHLSHNYYYITVKPTELRRNISSRYLHNYLRSLYSETSFGTFNRNTDGYGIKTEDLTKTKSNAATFRTS